MKETTDLQKKQELTLLDLVDRILDKGILLKGDLTISVADVDLIYLGVKLLVASVDQAYKLREDHWSRMKEGEI